MSELTSTTLDLEHIEHEATEKTVFGFWVYLMTDCVLFAGLFALPLVIHTVARILA